MIPGYPVYAVGNAINPLPSTAPTRRVLHSPTRWQAVIVTASLRECAMNRDESALPSTDTTTYDLANGQHVSIDVAASSWECSDVSPPTLYGPAPPSPSVSAPSSNIVDSGCSADSCGAGHGSSPLNWGATGCCWASLYDIWRNVARLGFGGTPELLHIGAARSWSQLHIDMCWNCSKWAPGGSATSWPDASLPARQFCAATHDG